MCATKHGPVPVCFDCKNRHVGCHADCEIYLDAKAEHDKKQEHIRQLKIAEYVVQDTKNKARRKSFAQKHARKYGV